MKKTRLLLVEDDKIQCGLLERVFAPVAAEFRYVSSARAALQLFPTYKPDVVITDMLMPGLNGLQLVRELRVLDPSVLIVGYSAVFVPDGKERAQLETAFDAWYERKPTTQPNELVEHVQRLLDARRRRSTSS